MALNRGGVVLTADADVASIRRTDPPVEQWSHRAAFEEPTKGRP